MNIDEFKVCLLNQIRDPDSAFNKFFIQPDNRPVFEQYIYFKVSEYNLWIKLERINDTQDAGQCAYSCVFMSEVPSKTDLKAKWDKAEDLTKIMKDTPALAFREQLQVENDCILLTLHGATIKCNDYLFVEESMSSSGATLIFDVSDKTFKPNGSVQSFMNLCVRNQIDSTVRYVPYRGQLKEVEAIDNIKNHYVVDVLLLKQIIGLLSSKSDFVNLISGINRALGPSISDKFLPF